MTVDDIVDRLNSLADPAAVAGMARFGISPEKALGISIPKLRKLAKEIGKDHLLAGELWKTGIHEARILAAFVDDPKQVDAAQMEEWVADFDSWDVCDQCCGALFDKTPYAYDKAIDWSGRKEEFVKRAGFAVMAWLAVHDKKAPDDDFLKFLPHIKLEANDERNYVKKAVNWALRQIGKRSRALNKAAVAAAREIQLNDSKAARWIAGDALRELTGDPVRRRLNIQ